MQKTLYIILILAGLGLVESNICAQEPADSSPATERTELVAVQVETLADDIQSGTGGLQVAADGNLFSADFGWKLNGGGKGGDKVFKVTPDGDVSVFCKGMRGASGNAMDSKGNLFQSSIGGNFISKITPGGDASVFVRKGLQNPVGIAIDEDDNLFVCNCGSGSIQKVTPNGEVSEFAKSDLLKCPNGITRSENGDFYIANFSNGNVLKIDSEGNVSKLATLPGNNNGHLTYHRGFLYVVARAANQIYRVTLDGKSSLFVGSGERGKTDGTPLQSTLSLPNDVGVSPDGRYMYINEVGPISGDHRILGPTRIRRVELRETVPFAKSAHPVNLQGPATKATMEDVAWIAGHWHGKGLGGSFEETWNPPMGGEMIGMFKHVKDGKVNFYELLNIVQKDQTLLLRLKHFSNEFVGWEEKDESVEFPLIKVTESTAEFDGLVFRRINENRMDIDVRIGQGEGEPQVITFECHRVQPNGGGEQAAMENVLKVDTVLSNQRNHASERVALGDAIRTYLLGLRSIDYRGCPESFQKAFVDHAKAWDNSLEFFDNHQELRGEMHQLLDEIREKDEATAKELTKHFQAIMKTWQVIEAAVERSID